MTHKQKKNDGNDNEKNERHRSNIEISDGLAIVVMNELTAMSSGKRGCMKYGQSNFYECD